MIHVTIQLNQAVEMKFLDVFKQRNEISEKCCASYFSSNASTCRKNLPSVSIKAVKFLDYLL